MRAESELKMREGTVARHGRIAHACRERETLREKDTEPEVHSVGEDEARLVDPHAILTLGSLTAVCAWSDECVVIRKAVLLRILSGHKKPRERGRAHSRMSAAEREGISDFEEESLPLSILRSADSRLSPIRSRGGRSAFLRFKARRPEHDQRDKDDGCAGSHTGE